MFIYMFCEEVFILLGVNKIPSIGIVLFIII